MVTGGWDGNNVLDSTEMWRTGNDITGGGGGAWQEISSAKLPRPMVGMRVSESDNRVFLFGEWR